jgi:hypothetical protein
MQFHLEIPNPDNLDDMPIFDEWGLLDELVEKAAKRLIPGKYSIVVTPDVSDEPGFLYGMDIQDIQEERNEWYIGAEIRTNDGETVKRYEFGPINENGMNRPYPF